MSDPRTRDNFGARIKLIFPALAPLYESPAPYSYSFIRFCTGAILFPHGVQKVFSAPLSQYGNSIGSHGLPFPTALAFLTYLTEFAGTACLALGLFTRLAAAMVGIQMLVIAFVFRWDNEYFWTNKGYEFPLLWALLCLAIFFRGGRPAGIPSTGSSGCSRVLVPQSVGTTNHHLFREALWAKFFTGAPARQRRSVERYSGVKRA
jgi:putative oxidoreductase